MSISTLQAAVERHQREIETLHRHQADEAGKLAQKADRLARTEDEAARTSSQSTRQSRIRESSRLRTEMAGIQKKQAELSRKLADRQRDLHRAQAELQKETSRQSQNVLTSFSRQALESQSRFVQQVRSLPRPSGDSGIAYDAFISHASEDKAELVKPLADALIAQDFRIWYDEFALSVGDSLRRSIDRGLSRSRYGIVVLSPSFFAKNWPQYELDGLVAKEMTGTKVILPIWHRVTKDDVLGYSPTLADRVALNTAILSVTELVEKLASVLRPAA